MLSRVRKRLPRTYFRARTLRRQGLAVVSFPKSGRTWLRFMLDQLGVPVRFSHENAERKASLEYTRENIRLSRYKRVILLHRNPLDTLVSYYHQFTDVDPRFSGSISEFIRDPGYGIRYLLQFNQAWLGSEGAFEAFMPVSYEELREDTAAGLRKIVDFCGVEGISDHAIAKAVRKGEFRSMKTLEETGKLAKIYPQRFAEAGAGRDKRKVRVGKIGNYRDELSKDDIDYCIAEARAVGWPIVKLLVPGDPGLRSEVERAAPREVGWQREKVRVAAR
jgi:hypothetical protein